MEINCDVCGYDLRDEDGRAVSAKDVRLLGATPEKQRVNELFGKTQFRICYVCYLKSLGVKEKNTPKSDTRKAR